jgi:hypothetical protein
MSAFAHLEPIIMLQMRAATAGFQFETHIQATDFSE